MSELPAEEAMYIDDNELACSVCTGKIFVDSFFLQV